MAISDIIPVIDLFAGPGGLGEGFSSFDNGKSKFKIVLSIEMDDNAHKTLELRAFYRQFMNDGAPKEYYSYLRGEIDKDTLFSLHSVQSENAKKEAFKAELGVTDSKLVDRKIAGVLRNAKTWVLIGGPPCQAYSLAGRSRNKGNSEYAPENDKRHYLYREYLRILNKHRPPVFVMENVKGLLSSKVKQIPIIDSIMRDLTEHEYNIYSFTISQNTGLLEESFVDPRSYVIKSELYGVPQARHRVILLGLSKCYNGNQIPTLREQIEVSVKNVIEDLPRVRSGLSKSDSSENWRQVIKSVLQTPWIRSIDSDIRSCIIDTVNNIRLPHNKRGGEFIACNVNTQRLKNWFNDPNFNGVCNHATRGHIPEDIHRYLFASCFAKVRGISPVLSEFPESLRPNHKNVKQAIENGSLFSDRFRVQIRDRTSTTITSHISKDGHYYIHYDPTQCRSLTVREAARLQTFPDNYFFCGPRTSQYHQVGNAVPPYLASQIAEIVWKILEKRI